MTLTRLISLLLVFLVYSSANIFMKLSAESGSLGISLLFFVGAVCVLGAYTYLWQLTLKHVPLTTAFMFKSITVIYGMVFATTLFQEKITMNNIVGVLFIVMGIVVLGWKSGNSTC